MTQGWECPRCGTVNAPWVLACTCTLQTRSTVTIGNDMLERARAFPRHTRLSQGCDESSAYCSRDLVAFAREEVAWKLDDTAKNYLPSRTDATVLLADVRSWLRAEAQRVRKGQDDGKG